MTTFPALPGLPGIPSIPDPPSDMSDGNALASFVKRFENYPPEFLRLIEQIKQKLRELPGKIEELRKAAEEVGVSIWRYVPQWLTPQWVTDFLAMVRRAVARIVEMVQALIEWVQKIIRSFEAGTDLYADAVTWLEIRGLTSEITTNLNIAVLNPNWIATGDGVRQTSWTGPAALAFEGSLPRQRDAVAAITTIAGLTSGVLMTTFGALMWIVSAVASLIIKIFSFIAEVVYRITTWRLPSDWFMKAVDEISSWLNQIKEVALALWGGRIVGNVQALWLDLLRRDNSAFTFRPDMSSTNVVVTWPDPTTQTPWPDDTLKIPSQPRTR